MSNMCVMYRAVGPSAYLGGKVNWMPPDRARGRLLSVRTVWILYGTAAISALQEGRCRHAVGTLHELDERELARAVDADIEMKLAFGGSDFGDVDVEVADRIGLELLLGGLVAFDLGRSLPRFR